MSAVSQRKSIARTFAGAAIVAAAVVVLGFFFGMRSVPNTPASQESFLENGSNEIGPAVMPGNEPVKPEPPQIATAIENREPSIHERIRLLADKINDEAIKVRDAHPEEGSFYLYQRDLRIATSQEFSTLIDADRELWNAHEDDYNSAENFGKETLGDLLVIELSRSSQSLNGTTVGALVTDLLNNTDSLALSGERLANTLELAGSRDAARRVRSSIRLIDLYDVARENRNALLARVDENYRELGLPGEWRAAMDRAITSAAVTEAQRMYSLSWRQREEEMKDDLKRLMIERGKSLAPR